MKKNILLLLSILFTVISCGGENKNSGQDDNKEEPVEYVFAKGADVSWLTEMENDGVKFYNASGNQIECMALLKSLGMNSVRLRVWVNPDEKWCNKEDVLVKAKRAAALGLRIMIDFHYSDWWADPGKQNKPAAWKDLSLADLITAVANHTAEVLTLLKTNNITPEWIQIGNETTNGMLWETGKASVSMSNYAQLNNAGYNAAKAVFPNSTVMIHIDNGWDNSKYRWLLDGIAAYGAKYDMIGMSLYPDSDNWSTLNKQCLANMLDVSTRYNTDVMVCEVGMSWDKADACKSFLTDLIDKCRNSTGDRKSTRLNSSH